MRQCCSPPCRRSAASGIDEHGVPAVAADARGRRPCRRVARVLARLLVARAARVGLEVVHLRAAAARVDPDADEIVDSEADAVRGLARRDRDPGLRRVEGDVQRAVVEQQVRRGRHRRRAPGGEVDEARAHVEFARLPARIGQRGVQRQGLRRARDGDGVGRGHRRAHRRGAADGENGGEEKARASHGRPDRRRPGARESSRSFQTVRNRTAGARRGPSRADARRRAARARAARRRHARRRSSSAPAAW